MSFSNPSTNTWTSIIDDQQAILYFLRRYKHRSEWFHADRLRQAVMDQTRRKARRSLALDLYEYLHDQGIDFHIEPQSASGIPDFVADQVGKERVIADTKLFWPERSKGKSYIISGFNQVVHIRLRLQRAMRLSGHLQDVPGGVELPCPGDASRCFRLSVNNKTIFFVVVDIFEHGVLSEQTGSDEERGHHGEGTCAECRDSTRTP